MKDLFIIPQELKLSRADFEALVDDQVAHIKKTLASKGQEYAPGQDDAMHNFNITAAMEQALTGKEVTREDAIWGMARKHFVSIMDMLGYIKAGLTDRITIEAVNEKFGDMINYLILLKASVLHTLLFMEETKPFERAFLPPDSIPDHLKSVILTSKDVPDYINDTELEPARGVYKPGYNGVPSSFPAPDQESLTHWIGRLASYLKVDQETAGKMVARKGTYAGRATVRFFILPDNVTPAATRYYDDLKAADLYFTVPGPTEMIERKA